MDACLPRKRASDCSALARLRLSSRLPRGSLAMGSVLYSVAAEPRMQTVQRLASTCRPDMLAELAVGIAVAVAAAGWVAELERVMLR